MSLHLFQIKHTARIAVLLVIVHLMANGLEIPYNHKVDYHKQNGYSSRVLYLEELK